MIIADCPTASEGGTTDRVAGGRSEQLMLLTVSLPVFVNVAVNVTSKFWLAWLAVITHCPGVVALPFWIAIDGFVVWVQVAFDFVVSAVLLTCDVPLHVIVSFAVVPACV